jgi:omega-6 fatty acid desaturase (delta-12 desaturase)
MNPTAVSTAKSMPPAPDAASDHDLKRRVAEFQAPDLPSGLAQILTSIGGFLAVCGVMYSLAGYSYWLALALSPVAGGLLVRTFIIQHDCGHGAFLRSRRWNDALGFACSILTLAPYLSWRRQHAGHHGIWNNLDRRNTGVDIYSTCLTVEEYRALSPWARRWHRFSRKPLIANIVAPPLVFLLLFRVPFDMPEDWRRERLGVHLTNAALIVVFGGFGWLLGFDRVALVQLPAVAIASTIGVWLFTVQHRSDHNVWARQDDWNATTASLEGSNHLRLPRILQWFTGNIGLHHIHHLNPRVPNYQLQPCQDAISQLHNVPEMTIRSAFRSMHYTLWDEQQERMVTFRGAESLISSH